MEEARIQQIKNQGLRVFKAKIAGVECVYRSLSRKEFRDLQKRLSVKTETLMKSEGANDTKLAMLKDDGEEQLVFLALLEPTIELETDIAKFPAGFVPTVAELIMVASGFNEEVEPTEL